jgi:Ca2+-binding RTX toxin-like protein
MTIQLSTITFTDEDDIVPLFEEDAIVNTDTANTLGGNDLITGTTITGSDNFGIWNSGTINTGAGHDIIIGICDENHRWIPNAAIRSDGGTINTDDGNDIIIGTSQAYDGIFIISRATINTGDGNDQIIGSAIGSGINVNSESIIDTGNGNDAITGIGSYGVSNSFIINTGEGNDKITGIGTSRSDNGIVNSGTMDTGAGNDEIIGTSARRGISNGSGDIIDTGDGNDKITGIGTSESNYGIVNSGTINTGAGNDEITGTSPSGGISNGFSSIIDTGDGNDEITGTGSIGISNGGTIKTGNGQDSIIAEGGFHDNGRVFLEDGKDYLKGFGRGIFNGGDEQDTLELTSGSYSFWPSTVGGIFIKNNITMYIVGFEKLIAGGTIYDFTSLTAGQIIVVA